MRFAALFLSLLIAANVAAQEIRVKPDEPNRRVDVTIDGRPFTSYRWDADVGRPFLWPVAAADGTVVSRGFPLAPLAGDSVDHPHQVGSSFSYGDVDGIDFWNWSTVRTPDELRRMGRIIHRRVVRTKNGKGRGELIVEADWVMPDGRVALVETTRFMFRAEGTHRIIDRETTLVAKGREVVFGDNKEGLFAFRVARELEQADQTGVKTIDGPGSAPIPNGEYFTSEGFKGNAAWGTTGRWAAVSGRIKAADVTVVVMDGPRNFGAPSSMMVRGYGLLALNPFGRKAFDPKAEARSFTLGAGRSLGFRHRLLIVSGKADAAAVEREYRIFEKTAK